MADVVAALDQGTTSTRCLLFDHGGRQVAAQVEHEQILLRPGWVEHDSCPGSVTTRSDAA